MAVNPNYIREVFLTFSLFIFLIPNVRGQSGGTSIIWEEENAIGVSFQINEEDNKFIEVFLKDKTTSILGKYEMETKEIFFYPIVPFTFGLDYEIRVRGEMIHEFSVPFSPTLKRPSVINIYPSSQIIPANLLKIHVQFSQPMQEGKTKNFIQVLNEKGEIIPNVLLDLQPELWNADRTNLTMWLDPGRIKRDLQPNLKMGPPLEVGLCYRVIISKAWKDQYGLELGNDFIKDYSILRDDRDKPSIHDWELTYPRTTSLNNLIVNFGESIDFELATNAITVNKDGQLIEGSTILKDCESQWFFTPEEKWRSGKYELVIESRLEDLAGNNLNRLFDHDLEKNEDASNEQKYHKISFTLNEQSMQ